MGRHQTGEIRHLGCEERNSGNRVDALRQAGTAGIVHSSSRYYLQCIQGTAGGVAVAPGLLGMGDENGLAVYH